MYKGVFVAIVTPFKNGKVDENALRAFVSWLIANGVHGIVPCGTTGEAATLSDAEYSQVVKTVVSEVGGRCPIIAGAGSNSTATAIRHAKMVVEAGANATLQVTPYYNKPTEEGLYQHFKAIAAAVNVPHILYNVPGRTALNMQAETTIRLSKIENIVGIKEACGDLEQIKKIKAGVSEDFSILSGNDDQNLEIYECGGVGAISVTGNVAPKEVSSVWNLFNAGKTSEARAAQNVIANLNDAMFIETNPIPVKTTLALMGMCTEEFKLPLTQMDSANKEKLKAVLKTYGLLA